jgi:stress response protein YsnF
LSEPSALDNDPKEAEADTPSEQSNNRSSTQVNSSTDNSATGQVIPINEERFCISKEIITEDIKIEKRWVTKTKKIQVPFLREEVYVNDRNLKYYQKGDGDDILSKVKERIKESFDTINKNQKKKYFSISEQHEANREIIPLFDPNYSDDNDSAQEIEKVIPIFGEEIVVSKRIVKLGELVIKKNRVTVNKKLEIAITKEKIVVEYPDGTEC